MFISVLDIVIMALGVISLAVWLLFYVKGLKYADMFEPLDDKDFRLKEIYFVGYAVMETLKYEYKSKSDRKLRQETEILYGEKYSEYYVRVVHAQKTTMAMTLFVFAFIFYGLSQEIAALFLLIGFAGLAYYYFGLITTKMIEKRSAEMMGEFSEVVSKLALLTNAGMILKEAWELTAYDGESTLYKEMQTTVDDMNNGMSELDAYHAFGKRCMVPEIKKFASTIVQGLTRGNSELTIALQNQSKEVWSTRQHQVKTESEKAGTKLMAPMMLMFVGILIMVLIPIFTNMGSGI
ncbi:MAG: type II secretion system F family protein [Clostridia bacterium]|nr:type II secretion system F family protein [Clostridia bacterium]